MAALLPYPTCCLCRINLDITIVTHGCYRVNTLVQSLPGQSEMAACPWRPLVSPGVAAGGVDSRMACLTALMSALIVLRAPRSGLSPPRSQ